MSHASTERMPARRVLEGVIVEHNGTAHGCLPRHATHPDVSAARDALDGLAAATLTHTHDATDPTAAERIVRGYLIDPRESGRIAAYWLENGQAVRRNEYPSGPTLDVIKKRLEQAGWRTEPMLRSSQCVFAHRPGSRGGYPADRIRLAVGQ